ncbi:patatin-like phospholipase family protein [Arenimonas sp.]|uniref:patatin-like phospholipase family protein n=1 Tax=Arenimonas sp. TaxID=1872635 RepID=UPI0039E2614C
MKTIIRMFVALACLAATAAQAETQPCRQHDPGSQRPRVGLVLGGGGARGVAHVAVIRELERLRIPIDCVAGTSMGSLIGGLYASGMSSAELEKLVLELDWNAAFNDSLDRPERSFRRKRDDDLNLLSAKPGIGRQGIKLAPGLLAGESISLLLQRLTLPVARVNHFDRLPIPFRAVATDINSGDAVVLSEGNLAEAMRASMSIPGAFRPVAIGDHLLVDGGIANQLPVDVARAMGADIVIAVDVGTPLGKIEQGASVLALADQLSGFMTVSNTKKSIESLGPRDVLIQPALGDQVKTADFARDKIELALRLGAEALPSLQSRLATVSRTELASATVIAAAAPLIIDFVRLDNRSTYSDAALLARLDFKTGHPLDADRLEAGIRRVYELGTLDTVTYDVIEEDGKAGLLVHVRPHAYGPTYLETGLSVHSDFDGEFSFNVRAGVLHAPVNALGGELRAILQLGNDPFLLGEYYQPLDARGRYFVGARGGYTNPKFRLYDEGRRFAEYELPSWGAEIYAGREFGNYGAVTLGLARRHGRAERLIGDPALPDLSFDQGEARWNITFDRLDSFQLPRAGTYFSIGQTYSARAIGADEAYTQTDFDLIHAQAVGMHSAYAGFRYHATNEDAPPIYAQYRLGGVTNLAGYRPNEILTPNYAMAYAGYTYELGRVVDRPAILGGTIEYGDLWSKSFGSTAHSRETHASLFFGFDSWLGRFLLGYGHRFGGRGTFFLELGYGNERR